MARYVPVREELHLAPEERLVVRRQLCSPGSELPADQRVGGIREERSGIAGIELLQVRARAQIGEQEKTLAQVLRMHLRRVHAGVAQQRRDVHERSAILLFRRRVHRDVARAVVERGAEVAAKACVFGRRRQREARAAELRRKPALQRIATKVGVYH